LRKHFGYKIRILLKSLKKNGILAEFCGKNAVRKFNMKYNPEKVRLF